MVLDKLWLRLHNRMHEIDYIKNEMWITDSDSETYHLISLRGKMKIRQLGRKN
jgi:hypothetical protein